MNRSARCAALAALIATASCSPPPATHEWARVAEITPAFLRNAAAFDPSLAAGSDGRLALTWVTRDAEGADVWLALSSDSGGHFGAPVRLNEQRGRVESYPESRPVAAFGPGRGLVVAWACARDSGAPAADIVVRASTDGGATFLRETFLNGDHGDTASRYHGFVALDFTPAGRVMAAWIDARGIALAPGEEEPFTAAIWSAGSDDGGRTWRENVRVATDVCPCCRPALRMSDGGRVVVAYRGARDSLRDPRLALSEDGGGTFARDTLVSADGWKLPGCPSTGPVLTLERDGGTVAWFTDAANGGGGRGPGVYAAAWRAGGGTGVPRALGDSLAEPTRPLLASMGPVTLVGVIARTGEGHARRAVGLRTLSESQEPSEWLFLGANARSAALAASDSRRASVAWVEQTDEGPRVRLAGVTRR